MVRRAGQFGLIAFTVLWFGVVLPGHQRGVVALPGAEVKASCCAKVGSMTVQRGEEPADEAPPRDPARDCAICQFTLTLDAPPPPVLFTPESKPAAILPVERTGLAWVAPHVLVRPQRGPPV